MSASAPVPAPAQRVALITGAAGDIGRGIALALASSGLHIGLTDLPSRSAELEVVAEAVRAKGVRAVVVTGDISVEEDVEAIVAKTVDELGALDVMVANAGIFRPKPLLDTTVEEWDAHASTNARGCMLCYKVAARQMVAQGRGGRIIGGCSVAGLTGAPLCSAYCASKFAIRGLTMCAALELAPHGITVNAYAPGFIEGTKMVDTLQNGSAMMGVSPEDWRKGAEQLFPLGRFGKVEEIAGIVSYFASDAAAWTTGKIYAVDGGMHMS